MMVFATINVTILSEASITHENVSHQVIEQQIQDCSHHENTDRYRVQVVCPGNAAPYDAGKHDRQAEPVWKILLQVKVCRAAQWTGTHALSVNCPGPQRCFGLAP